MQLDVIENACNMYTYIYTHIYKLMYATFQTTAFVPHTIRKYMWHVAHMNVHLIAMNL